MNIEDIKLAKELYKFKMSLEPFREVFIVGNKIIPLKHLKPCASL